MSVAAITRDHQHAGASDEVLFFRFGEAIRFEDAAGTRLQVLRGSVWITQEGDLEDYFLLAPGTITLDRPGLSVVHAIEPGEIVVGRPLPQISVAARVAGGFARLSRTLAAWVASRFGPKGIENQRLRGWHGVL